MNNNMPVYYKCNMTKMQHIGMYIAFAVGMTVICWLFYHVVILAVIAGVILGFPLERLYAKSTIKKRQMALRLQFKEFLSSMAVAVRAGNVEKHAIKAALKDLQLQYNEKTDIIREVKNIITQSEGGGVALKDLFEDFAARSELEDVASFATIYGVIEGKSDHFGDILTQTESIISEKIEIEAEIETTITSAKSETTTMLFMPVVIVVAMSLMGSGLLDVLFLTTLGHVIATVALIIFAVSFYLMVKATDVEV